MSHVLRRLRFGRLVLVLAALAAASCQTGQDGGFEPIVLDLSKKPAEEGAAAVPPPAPSAGSGLATPTSPAKAPAAAPAAVPAAVKGMSLKEKVGQIFVVAGHGIFLNEEAPAYKELARQVTENRVGGVHWFRSSVYETAVLNEKLQRLAKVPLLVSADLEAGTGMRFEDVTVGPWAMAVAATGDVTLAERYARATATEARALGIAQIYAPVADVNVNPDNPVINVRSFGEDPEEVARFVVATVKGLQSGRVAATLKHFPGHGDTAVDSHRALAVVPADRVRLDAVELLPFRAGIAAGAKSVMVSHLAVAAIDPTPAPPLRDAPKELEYKVTPGEISKEATTPATLSAPIVTDLLRKQMGFAGLVVTDAMGMNGISLHLPPGEAAVRALLAGVDVVLMSPDPDGAIQAVLEAVKAGRISEARLNESVERVLTLKRSLKLYDEPTPDLKKISSVVDSPENRAIEAEIARRSLTLVREKTDSLPLKKEAKLLSLVVSDEATLNGPAGALTAELKSRVPGLTTVRLDPRSTGDEVKAAVAAAKDADAVILSLFVRARSGQGPVAVPEPAKAAVPQLLASGKPVVAVAFGSPYLLRDFPGLSTYVCAWGTQDVMQKAAANALFGEAAFEGKMPVSIPGLAERGAGIAKAASPAR
jgi:beta-N-acetylhexosaminidase